MDSLVKDELQAVEVWAGALLARLKPAALGQLMREIARELRRSQQQRIAAQRNPDGSAFTPRKARTPPRSKQLREKIGRIRRKRRTMFVKLRTARFFKVESDARSLAIGFSGRVARLAQVHQYGQTDRVAPGGSVYRYPVRILLGLTPEEREMIRDRWLAAWVK